MGCIKMIETILAPIYIYLYAGEEPIGSTYIGGTILIATIIGHSIVALREEHPPVVAVDDNDEEDDTNDETTLSNVSIVENKNVEIMVESNG